MRDFILAVKVPLYDFIGLDESVKLPLQLVILLSQNSLVAVQLLQLPSEVIVPLHEGFIAIFQALNVSAESFNVLVQVLDVLICDPCALVQLLALDNFLVLLAEESLLELDCLGIGASKLLDLIIESSDCLFYLVTIS